MSDERLWSVEELAEAVSLTPRRIRQMCAAGEIQAQKVGRDWVIPDGEAKRIIEERSDERDRDR
jgi:excisionase family DNA binding protein